MMKNKFVIVIFLILLVLSLCLITALPLLAAPPPSVTSISPSSGPTVGGTSVTITGNNFQTGATLTIGDTAATGVIVVSATSITATTPPGTAGAQSVVVNNPDSKYSNGNTKFTYVPAPTTTSISPIIGPLAGGTSVTIAGTGFATSGTVTVTIGGTTATSIIVVNSATITAVTPSGTAGAKSVIVTNPDTQSSNSNITFTYTAAPPPTITSICPSSGPAAGGTSVTITGTGFATSGTVTVTMGGIAATNVTVVSATSITATTPSGTAGAKSVVVTNLDTQSSNSNITFTYEAAPTVISISPSSGPATGGTNVTITGTGFINGATVTIGGTVATGVTVVSATSITAATPSGTTGAKSVIVTNPDTQSSNSNITFTYTAAPPPTITSISPSSGPAAGGTGVTITGTAFVTGATVTIGGTAATNVTVVSATSITATTPSGAAGAKSVVVTNPDTLYGSLANGFTYMDNGGDGGGGTGAPSGPTTIAGVTNLNSSINAQGIFNQEINAWSDDNNVLLDISAGTTGLNSSGAPLTQISIIHMTTPPSFQSNAGMITLAYDLTPTGCKFNSSATIRFSYDPTLIPAGVAPASLQIAYYDSTSSSWITLPSTIDNSNHFISAQITHFTQYAVTYGV